MPATIKSLKRKLEEGATLERCGIVLKSGRVLDAENVHENPAKGFMIDPKFLRKHLNSMAGTWHTHPGQSSQLSQDDYLGFAQWPGYTHYIIGTDGVRAYVADEEGMVSECT